jgi:hypothetical protein
MVAEFTELNMEGINRRAQRKQSLFETAALLPPLPPVNIR